MGLHPGMRHQARSISGAVNAMRGGCTADVYTLQSWRSRPDPESVYSVFDPTMSRPILTAWLTCPACFLIAAAVEVMRFQRL
ncbi:hypothetical protein MMB17_21085 [Methylobacterium organophilum]|uniref:hypothetical protein n=1 Tax=Methylobacterium organophilum TaxID=410 RepID=UPI001F13746D|nr:hypothetical protein [Methylobacterium organophilum]UMY17112.1 hypothetical protein MMB17_21085 [Methylobacterium organophilum]